MEITEIRFIHRMMIQLKIWNKPYVSTNRFPVPTESIVFTPPKTILGTVIEQID